MFPKLIPVRGVHIPVDSWEELDELITRYGSDVVIPASDTPDSRPQGRSHRQSSGGLATQDRAILKEFVENDSKGIVNRELGPFFGVSGKAINPALRKWAMRVRLADSENSTVFEPFNRPDGRGYRLSSTFMKVAKAILEEQ